MKEPVIRLNKELREEILGNVMENRFDKTSITREIALEGFRLLKEVNVEYRTLATTLIAYSSFRRFQFNEHWFLIARERKRGVIRKNHTIHLTDLFTPDQKETTSNTSYGEREETYQELYAELFEGEAEITEKGLFIGFVSPSNDTTVSLEQSKYFFELVATLNKLEKDRSALEAQVSAVLTSCYNMKQLVEVWPNVVDYAPAIIPSPTGTALTIRVEDIDALLAIS